MGLDNIPRNYPCHTAGTAVTVKMIDVRTGDIYVDENGDTHDQTDCDATQACGGCPWKNTLGSTDGVVYGIMGTSCWYRGKYGALLLDAVEVDANRLWGDGEGIVAPEVCREIAGDMEERATTDGEPFVLMMDDEDVTAQYWYLRDWLNWVADECDGAVAWY